MIFTGSSHQRLQLIKEQLDLLGYQREDQVVADYEFTTNEGIIRASAVAFGDPRIHDIGTACIAVHIAEKPDSVSRVAGLLRFTGAPVAFVSQPHHIDILPLRARGEASAKKILYSDLSSFVQRHLTELKPSALLESKTRRKQLSLFELDPSLTSWARQATREVLVKQFEEAYHTSSRHLPSNGKKDLLQMGISLLAARILADKNLLLGIPPGEELDPDTLVQAAQKSYPNYFGRFTTTTELTRPLFRFYEVVTKQITFSNFTNDILGHFYESALVTPGMQKRAGIYYTPSDLADRMVDRLPFEHLKPADRTIFDGTCGSGSLLLSAHRRLFEIPSSCETDEPSAIIFGMDYDPFAVEIASLSLLLFNMPDGNHWKICQGDILKTDPISQFGIRPGIIVANPPFREKTKSYHQKAIDVLNRYMEWLIPGGMMAIVLPHTFLQNRSGREARAVLLQDFDILELWELPGGAVSSSQETAVLLVQKGERQRTLVQVQRWLTSESSQPPEERYSFPQKTWSSRSDARMVASPVESILNELEERFQKIDPHYCKLRNGMQPGRETRESHFAGQKLGERWRPVLYSNSRGQVLSPYLIIWDAGEYAYIKYPSSEFHSQRTPEEFDVKPKVILNATRNSWNPWRLLAAIDRTGLVVTENFHICLPVNAVPEEIVAVLNSPVANAWFSGRNAQRDINLGDLRNMPFPSFGTLRNVIVELVRTVESITSSAQLTELEDIVNEIDEIVFDAYHLDVSDRQSLVNLMSRYRRPGIGRLHDRVSAREEISGAWMVPGVVEDIDVVGKSMDVWLAEYGSIRDIPVPSLMPGWALHPGVPFLASVVGSEDDKIRWMDFRPLDFGYLEAEDLVAALSLPNCQ